MTSKACKHCGEISNYAFCCAGCESAYNIIKGMGLNSFYAKKEKDSRVRPSIPEVPIKIDFNNFITTDNNIHSIYLMVDGIHCAACVWLIEHILNKHKNILHARVNMTTKRLTIKWQGNIKLAEEFIKQVHSIGYRLMPFDPKILNSKHKQAEKQLLICMAVAGFASANVMLFSISLWSGIEAGSATASFMQWLSALIALPALIYAGKPFYSSALSALKSRRLNMDVPISLAVISAGSLSLYETIQNTDETYFDSAIMLLFFLLIGRYLDQYMKNKTYNIAENLIMLEASSATIINKNGDHKTVATSKIKVGNILLVTAGERIPADGIIVNGNTEIDNSIISGESLPISLKNGDSITAGALNIGGTIHIKATAVGKNSTISRIAELIETSTNSKNKFTSIADKAAKIYAPAVHLLALITFSYWFIVAGASMHDAILYAVAVLIVTCPCALALSVPAVHVALTSNLLKRGILIKNSTAIERLKNIKHIIFDKTGTITTGEFVLQNKVDNKALNIAANLAKYSKHPLCKSLATLITKPIIIENIKETAGAGICGTYKGKKINLGSKLFCKVETITSKQQTELWFKTEKNDALPFYFSDKIKADAKQTIKNLNNYGAKITLLSGDNKSVVQQVAKHVAINDFYFGQTPKQKHAFLNKLKNNNVKTLMVGDGINDAPALAEAYASMSFSNASHISQNSADIILQSPHLNDITHTLNLAKKADNAVKINFALSIGYNTIAVPLAMSGYITPLYAALFMSASSLAVMLNALRLRS